MRLEKRNHTSPAAYVLAPVGAVVFTLIVSALLVLWAGAPVGQTYALLLQGARRQRLTAFLYGGANILKGLHLGSPGERNVLFTRNYLTLEGIPVHDESVLALAPRKIYFQARRGRAKIRGIRDVHNRTIFERELEYRHRLRNAHMPIEGEVFGL